MPEHAAPHRDRDDGHGGHEGRYVIKIDRNAGGDCGLTIVDLHRRAVLTQIVGREARYLLQSRSLPRALRERRACRCDKTTVCQLLLAVTAIVLAFLQLDQALQRLLAGSRAAARPQRSGTPLAAPDETLGERLIRLGVILPDRTRLVAAVLFAYRGEHLSCDDIKGLLALDAPFVADLDPQPHLSRLTRAGIVQRIDEFHPYIVYDTDISAHPHRLNPDTGRVEDVMKTTRAAHRPAKVTLIAPKTSRRS